jgi:hypothetical protein
MNLVTLRRLLLIAVCMGIAALAGAAIRARSHTRRTGLAIAGAAALFWGVPYFAPGLSHGPGDAALLFALAGLVVKPGWATDLGALLPYAAVFGAVVVFFEAFTGQLPIASAWLAALVLAALRDESRPGPFDARLVCLVALVAFGVGGVITVVIKQVLAALFAEPAAGSAFMNRLDGYLAVPCTSKRHPGTLGAIRRARAADVRVDRMAPPRRKGAGLGAGDLLVDGRRTRVAPPARSARPRRAVPQCLGAAPRIVGAPRAHAHADSRIVHGAHDGRPDLAVGGCATVAWARECGSSV